MYIAGINIMYQQYITLENYTMNFKNSQRVHKQRTSMYYIFFLYIKEKHGVERALERARHHRDIFVYLIKMTSGSHFRYISNAIAIRRFIREFELMERESK